MKQQLSQRIRKIVTIVDITLACFFFFMNHKHVTDILTLDCKQGAGSVRQQQDVTAPPPHPHNNIVGFVSFNASSALDRDHLDILTKWTYYCKKGLMSIPTKYSDTAHKMSIHMNIIISKQYDICNQNPTFLYLDLDQLPQNRFYPTIMWIIHMYRRYHT